MRLALALCLLAALTACRGNEGRDICLHIESIKGNKPPVKGKDSRGWQDKIANCAKFYNRNLEDCENRSAAVTCFNNMRTLSEIPACKSRCK